MNQVDHHGLRTWATHELALRVARVCLSELERNGVRALAVKGVVLARHTYNLSRRPIADVDLLISRADFRRALDVARAARWRIVWDSKTLGNVNFVVEQMAVDVACSFGPTGVSALSVSTVMARASRSDRPLGFPHWQIDTHDHALLIAIDAFKDKLGSGKPWAREDLVQLATTEGFSPRILVERAAAAHLRTMLAIVAAWVISTEPSAPWSAVHRQLGPIGIRPGYIERYHHLLAARRTSILTSWYLSLMTRAVSDSVRWRAFALALGAAGTAHYVARHGSLHGDPWDVRRQAGSQ
jgi:hypothetical protein